MKTKCFGTTLLFENEGKKYAFDIVSYNLLEIDDVMYYALLIRFGVCTINEIEKKYDTRSIGEVLELFDLLKNNNIFFSEDLLEEQFNNDVEVGQFSLPPVHTCNLNCKYCFADAGAEYKEVKREFTREQIEKTLRYIYYDLMPECKKYRIDFVSGGEPLLNFEIIKWIREVGDELYRETGKPLIMWMCTNGTLLTKEIVEKLNLYRIKWGISLDGTKDIHDSSRIDKSGNGTYNRIVSNIKKIEKQMGRSNLLKNVWALSVITSETKSLIDILKHHYQLGFRNIQIKPVRLCKESELAITNNNVEYIMKMYTELFSFFKEEWNKGDYSYLLMMLNDIDFSGKVFRRLVFSEHMSDRCYAGKSKFSFQANGDVYPCDSFVGIKEFCVGNIDSSLKNLKDIRRISLFKRKKCMSCWARYLCGGNCLYNSLMANNDILEPDKVVCELKKHVILENILLIEYMSTTNEKLLNEILHLIKLKDAFL